MRDHWTEVKVAREATLAPTEKAAAKLASQHKLYVRDRIALLVDEGSFVEDSQLANALNPGLPAGARITDQVELFPGRRGAGRIFHNQVALSGKVPQICCLFGPSAAGGAYIPSFCDIVIMVEGNASMYLGSPRMAEMVIGERTTLEEMGGARIHATVSGCGDNLAVDDADALDLAKTYFSYMPGSWRANPPSFTAAPPARPFTRDVVPPEESLGYDIHEVID